jgi:hypothetical protein
MSADGAGDVTAIHCKLLQFFSSMHTAVIARQTISLELGHERPSITAVYVGR